MALPVLTTVAGAQTVTNWTGGNGNWSDSGMWDNGVPNGGSFDARVDNGNAANSSVILDGSFTVGSLEIDSGDSVSLSNNQNFNLNAGGFAGAGVLTNNGTFTIATAGNSTNFIISGDSSLLGSGVFTLGGGNARIYAGNGSDRLTIGASQTVNGVGQIGIGSLSLTNNGLIDANDAGGNSLVLQPNGGTDFTNAFGAIMQASNGGVLTLQSGSFLNSGTIQALNGSRVNLVSPNISGGILTTAGTGEIHNVGGATLTSVTSNGSLIIDNNTGMTLSTGLTNNGTFTINSVGNSTDLILANPLTIDGTGTITMTNGSSRIYARNGSDRLTIGASQTIQGIGQIGIGSLSLTNNGLIDANNSAGSLVLQPNGGTDFTNNATMQASGGGVLQLQNGSFINTTGAIQALNGSRVNLVSPNISGGILTTAGTGEIHNVGGATLTSVTSNGSLIIDNNTGMTLSTGLTNNGTLTINSVGNNTDLILANPLTIDGTGTITMANGSSRIYASNGTDRLSIGASQTIQGIGQIGIGLLSLTNNGLIDANNNTGTLVLQPKGGTDFTNNSTMQASGGGILQLQSQSFINTTGTIQALNGSTVNLVSPSVSGGTLTTAGSGTIHDIGGASLTSVTNNGTFILDNNQTLYLSTGLTNDGTLTINSAGNNTDLRILNPLTIDGAGTITMTNGASRIYASNGTDRLTIGASQTIQGMGQIGIGLLSLTNNGVIDANNTGALVLQPSSAAGEDFTNNATMQASNGGTLVLQGGQFNNNGTIQALTGSIVNLTGNPQINGGTITTTGTGEVHIIDHATMTNVINSGVLIASNNTTTDINTGLTNDGTLTINSAGNSTDLRILSPLTIGGGGTTTMTNAARIYAANGADRLTVGTNQTINGTGQIGIGDLALTNNGLIDANVAGNSISMQPNGGAGEDFTNNSSGIWQASNGGTMSFQAGTYNNSGTIQALDGSTVIFVSNANLTNNSGGTLTGGTYKAISIANAAVVNLSNGNVTNNAAAVYLDGALASIPQINTIANNQTGGEFHVLGGKTFTTAGAFTNAGTVEIGSGSTLSVGGTANYVQTAGLTIVNGSLNPTGGNVILQGNSTLDGSGTVWGVLNNSTGIVSPGNSPGMLTVNGNYVQSDSSVLDIELAGTIPGSEYDVLNITNTASIGGTLNVSLLGFTPSFGDTFTILQTVGPLTGTFSTVNLPAGMSIDYTPTSVELNVVPEPASAALLALAAFFAPRRARRRSSTI